VFGFRAGVAMFSEHVVSRPGTGLATTSD
jgi:hypothetical protein